MPLVLRIILIVSSILTFGYVASRIRKEKLKLENAIFWILLSIVLVILGLFPQMMFALADCLGIMSSVNLVYLVVIFILLYKVFDLSIKLARVQERLDQLVQVLAIKEHNKECDGNEE